MMIKASARSFSCAVAHMGTAFLECVFYVLFVWLDWVCGSDLCVVLQVRSGLKFYWLFVLWWPCLLDRAFKSNNWLVWGFFCSYLVSMTKVHKKQIHAVSVSFAQSRQECNFYLIFIFDSFGFLVQMAVVRLVCFYFVCACIWRVFVLVRLAQSFSQSTLSCKGHL